MERLPSDDFVKVYAQILESSIASNYELRHFFEDMLKLADWRTGIVDMTTEAIGRRINLSVEKVEQWIGELEKPDLKSRCPDKEGRRLVRLDEHRDWGWQIVNYEAYRITRCASERKEYNRRKQAEWRARKKEAETIAEPLQSVTKHYTLPVAPETYTSDCRVILHYLNDKSGHRYRECAENLDRIQKRLNEGVSVEDCKTMIDHRCRDWKGRELQKFLRPSTLFGEKFDEYLGQKDSQIVRNVNGRQVRVVSAEDKTKRELDQLMKGLQ